MSRALVTAVAGTVALFFWTSVAPGSSRGKGVAAMKVHVAINVKSVNAGHGIYGQVIKRGEGGPDAEVRVARIAAVIIGIVAIMVCLTPVGSSDTASYEYEPTAPPAPSVTAAQPAGKGHSPSFTVSDAEDVTLTYDCVVTAASSDASLTVPAPVCGPTTTLDLSGAPDDVYTLTVTATDEMGQTSVAGSDSYTFDSSTATPSVSLSSPSSSPGTDTSPTFDFTDAEAADTFSCEWDGPDGSVSSSGPCPSGASMPTAGHGDGSYTLTVTATDAVGNTASAPAGRHSSRALSSGASS